MTRPSVVHHHADHPHREVGALVPDARHSAALARSHLEALEPRYPEGRLGYRHRGRGRHRRYPGPKLATTDRCRRAEVPETRRYSWRSSRTCPVGKVVVERGRPLVRRVQPAAEMPTRRQVRHCVVARASLHIFSRLPSAWRSYDSGNVRVLDSAQTVATMATTVCIGFRRSRAFGRSCFKRI